MMNFKKYCESRLSENQQDPKNALMASFQQEFQKDPQGSLTWLNNLYKNFYSQWQKTQQQQPQQQNQNQQPQTG